LLIAGAGSQGREVPLPGGVRGGLKYVPGSRFQVSDY